MARVGGAVLALVGWVLAVFFVGGFSVSLDGHVIVAMCSVIKLLFDGLNSYKFNTCIWTILN